MDRPCALIKYRVGQSHTFMGMYGVHTVFSKEITIYTVIYGADIRFWPTLIEYQA
jgi:hypothetical protein